MSDPNVPPGAGGYADSSGGGQYGGGQYGGGQDGGGQDGGGQYGGAAGETKGFFGALFDFSFNSFVTPKIVKFVYVLSTVLLVLGYLVYVIVGFATDSMLGVLVLLLGWIPVLLYLAFIRMTLEFYYSVVRMSQDINRRLPMA